MDLIKKLFRPLPAMRPEGLSARRAELGKTLLLLDVRNLSELEMVRIDPCLHIPLRQLEDHLDELEPWRDRDIVALCHHGFRSASAQRILLRQGFKRVFNLSGGIHAYAVQVDPSLRRY